MQSPLLQLPKDVLIHIIQRAGGRERETLFATCQALRELTLQISAVTILELTDAPSERRPLLIGVFGQQLSGLKTPVT
jgi:hypothetical protein